jgi:predicted outer membrane repeat protein
MRYDTLACFTVAVLTLTAPAATYTIQPDGTGDFPTIQAAIDASSDGDVVELTDGTFIGAGNRDVDFSGKAVLVRSAGGDPETCIINCEGIEADPHRGFIFQNDEGPGSVIQGITIAYGWAEYYGGGVFCDGDASPTLVDCVFLDNEASTGGAMCGGVLSTVTGCSFVGNEGVRGGAMARAQRTVLTDCEFFGNKATYGGAIYIRSSCSPTVTGCSFTGNSALHSGGALHIEQHCKPLFSHCTLAGNSAPIGGAVDVSIECSPTFANCTFWGNSSTYTGVIACYELCTLGIENSIISFSQEGAAVSCFDSEAALRCCDIYRNAGGDWVGCVADQYGVNGNICDDPLFCFDDYPEAPYALHDDSPCAPEHDPACGLIGAWDVGCGATPVEETSWGSVKAMFR